MVHYGKTQLVCRAGYCHHTCPELESIMAILINDGNGGRALLLNRTTTISLGVAVVLLSAAIAYGMQCSTVAAHCADGNIHWTKQALDEAYVPRREYAATLEAIREDLKEIKADVKELKRR